MTNAFHPNPSWGALATLRPPQAAWPRIPSLQGFTASYLRHVPNVAGTLRPHVATADMVTERNQRALDALDDLRKLADDWDGEGAPRPSDEAIERAKDIVRWACDRGIDLGDAEIDADVLGGVAIWIEPRPGRRAWIACMNSGHDTLVLSDDGVIKHAPWNETAQQRLLSFIRSGHDE